MTLPAVFLSNDWGEANYYVVTILALHEPYDAYARNWQFQLLMFSIFHLPQLLVVLALIIALELIAFHLPSKKPADIQQ